MVQFVFIDTVLLAGVIHPLNSFNPPPGPVSIAQADQQWTWIEETLMYSNADWIIVAGHYPGMSHKSIVTFLVNIHMHNVMSHI